MRLFTNNFIYFGDKQRFFYSSKTRMKSIHFIAWKELICSLGVVVLFQYINYDYYTSLNKSKISKLTISEVQEKIDSYQTRSLMGLAMVVLIFAYIAQKIIFKSYFKLAHRYQIWFYTDIIISISNMAGIIYIN